MKGINVSVQDRPFVTVVAPCRNEVKHIEKAIESILNNEYPRNKMELLIVDGMSNDGTREIVSRYEKTDARVRLIDNPDKIVPTAMNIGIKAARGEYIVRIDCHSWFAPDYIDKCIEVLERTNASGVGGYWETVPGNDTETARAIAAATSSKFGVGNSALRTGGCEREADTIPFGSYRKSIFEKVGFYDERLVRNQDIELNSRIWKTGGTIVISPKIKLKYYNRATYKGIWQQSFNNGLWNPYTVWLAGGGLRLRHFVPMFFVLSIIILGMASVLYGYFAVLLAAELLLYISAAAFFAVRTARNKNASACLILWTYIVLHIAYGLGSVWAVLTIPFKFPDRKSRKVGTPLADRV